MRESIIGTEAPEQWQSALSSIPHSYWHTWRAMQALERQTRSPGYLYVCEDSESGNVAACPFMEREWRGTKDIYTPAGFTGFVSSGHMPNLRSAWDAFVRSNRYICGYFALHPILASSEYHVGIESSNELFVVDLRRGIDHVFAGLSENVKRSVRRWRRTKSIVIMDRERLIAFLLENYRAFMTAMSARPGTIWPQETLAEMCNDPDLLMMGAADEEGLCAVVAIGITSHCAEYHLNINVRDGRKCTAALIWSGIQRLVELEIPSLHLGGGIRPRDGVARAKERYGPSTYPLKTAKEIYDLDRYEALCEEAGTSGSASAGRFFPAYRAHASSASGAMRD